MTKQYTKNEEILLHDTQYIYIHANVATCIMSKDHLAIVSIKKLHICNFKIVLDLCGHESV